MGFHWQYPVFIVRHQGGFASVEVGDDGSEPVFAIAVFTTLERAEQFIAAVEIEATAEAIGSERDFARLVAALKEPFRQVVFDAAPQGNQVNAQWQVAVSELLEKHLPLARSPWDYPVFVLVEADGYAAIEAGEMAALALFTDLDRLADYQQNAAITGYSQAVARPEPLAELLRELPPNVDAVAINPTVSDGKHTATDCVRVKTLLEKYLRGA